MSTSINNIIEQEERYIHTQEDNIVLELQEDYIPDSVKVWICDDQWNKIRELTIVELGSKYVQLTENLVLNNKLTITYNIRTLEFNPDTNILVKLKTLEDLVLKQKYAIEQLTKALDNRVSTHTFRLWINAIERSYGKPILQDNLLGIQGVHQSCRD